jgi:formate hydrogenlyase transcriptional activator
VVRDIIAAHGIRACWSAPIISHQGEILGTFAFYRLNVFPVMLPPLRERQQDIAQLVSHFVEMYARKMDKRVTHIPKETLTALIAYPWPGNVRELQNLIERAVILSNNGVLPNPLPTSDKNAVPLPVSNKNPLTVTPSKGTFNDSTRALILQALREAGWVIGGSGGAAARLGLKRTTLIAKMKKLGISRPVRKDDINPLSENRESEEWWHPTVE